MIKAVLFDLDGTLLPMDQDVFVKNYFKRLAIKLAPLGYDAEKLIQSVWEGTAAMVANDGSTTNEEAFWKSFEKNFGPKAREDEPVFEEYYAKEFQAVKDVCGYNEKSSAIVELLKNKGIRRILATNPLFPRIATESRTRWAGLDTADFEIITTYETSHYCKPNGKYFEEILALAGLTPEECIMVGNDVEEDMLPCRKLGMEVFLLSDCLINKPNIDIDSFPQGGFDELEKFLNEKL